MAVVIRTLLVCLLVLALPMQATLAATQAFCTTHHPGDAAAHAMSGATTGATVGAHAHHDACTHSTGSVAGMPLATPQADIATAADLSCSACAACCAPGAVAALAQGLPAGAPVPTVFGAVKATVEAFASGGPDRPPRGAIG